MNKFGIIYGGRSTEHDASIKSMENIACTLKHNSHIDYIYVSRNGEVEINGHPSTVPQMIEHCVQNRDFYYINLLHGTEGEDGSWSGVADICDFIGSFESVFTSSVLMHKFEQGLIVRSMVNSVKVPQTVIFNYTESDEQIEKKIRALNFTRLILKPNSMGASHFTCLFSRDEISAIMEYMKKIFEYDDSALVQEYIDGEEYTCGVFRSLKGMRILPIIHVKSYTEEILGHKSKHNKNQTTIDFDDFLLKDKIEETARVLTDVFRIKFMCRFDFIVKDGDIYFLEGNLIPGFSAGSAFPMMLKREGISLDSFFIGLAEYSALLRKKCKYLPYTIVD